MTTNNLQERFCSHCAKSFVPLDVPHLSADCGKCGRTSFYVRYDADGGGIRIEAGERFTVPAGFIKLSLDPSSRGKLFRSGLPFLVKQLFLGVNPKSSDQIQSFAEELSADADSILKKSKVLEGLNLEDEKDATEAFKRLNENQESREWHAMGVGALSQQMREAIEGTDAKQAAWAAYMLGTYRGLTIVTEPLFEQTLWRGYLANDVVYEAAAAASRTPAEAEAIKRLSPLFQRLDEETLHTWVESKQPIGPKIGVRNLPEETLRALAKWHLTSFERNRQNDLRSASDRRASWDLRLKWLSFGLAIPTTIFTALKLLGIA